MMEEELKVAYETARKGTGKPRILPIRIAFEDVLPPELGDILDPLQYSLWKSPEDDGRVTGEISAGALIVQEGAYFDGNSKMATGGGLAPGQDARANNTPRAAAGESGA